MLGEIAKLMRFIAFKTQGSCSFLTIQSYEDLSNKSGVRNILIESSSLFALMQKPAKPSKGHVVKIRKNRRMQTFRDAFGTGGKEAAEMAVEISEDRRKEVESERKKLSARRSV